MTATPNNHETLSQRDKLDPEIEVMENDGLVRLDGADVIFTPKAVAEIERNSQSHTEA